MTPWIGVDLDGTLAKYDDWKGNTHIGEPIILMVNRVKEWLAAGKVVKIFTARVCENNPETLQAIETWCLMHLGQVLSVTNVKDYGMVELWDDRCVQVVPNTGLTVDEYSALDI